jgi:trehalose 6-phosphate phosphatase
MGGEHYHQPNRTAKNMKLFLMLDYDGTLTPIVKNPMRAILSAPRKKMLKCLARQPEIKLAIISGRKLSVVKRLVGISKIIYVGNHGYEILAGGKHWIHPAAKKSIPLFKKIKAELEKKLHYQGLLIEDKGLTLSLHYRSLAKSALPAFKKDFKLALMPWRRAIKITSGKKVYEVRPPLNWDKGQAVRWLIKNLKLQKYAPVYIGDDQTDEDAFKVLKGRGLTYLVGKTSRTAAKRRFGRINDVYRFLSNMIQGERCLRC